MASTSSLPSVESLPGSREARTSRCSSKMKCPLLGLVLFLVILLDVPGTSGSSPQANQTKQSECKSGLILPRWPGYDNLSLGDRISRGLVYFLALCYMFVGVAIVADRFMAAIEVITSQEKEVTIKKPNGETQTVTVRIWNETVANLTLMALGSSAPEILLSIIEIIGAGFEAGELGPGTIVGSAAFNLFIIIGLCVYVVPSNECRRIKHLRVFFITATWSVFAYVWLYIILSCSSPRVIDVWEALLTFIFFPLTVLTAYIADRQLLIYKYLSKNYRMNKRGVIVEGEGDVELANASKGLNHVTIDGGGGSKMFEMLEMSPEFREVEQQRSEYIQILHELRQKHPGYDLQTLERMATDEILCHGPKSRAFYRIQANRKLIGAGNVLKKHRKRRESEDMLRSTVAEEDDDTVTEVFFDPDHYTVMENVGDFTVTVTRAGGDLNLAVYVDYKTEDGTANAGSDYHYAEGTLIFRPGETHKQFQLSVIDDDVFEDDEHFYVRLSNIRVGGADGRPVYVQANGSLATPNGARTPVVKLGESALATIMILDDDHAGVFCFAEAEQEIAESIGQLCVAVNRFSGARGRVMLPYRTVESSAKAGKDFEAGEGEVIFENNETEKNIEVNIIEEDSYEKDVTFYIELGEPKQLKEGDTDSGAGLEDEIFNSKDLTEEERIARLGKPRLSEPTKMQIRIKESKEFKNTVDKLVKQVNMSLMVGTSSWKEQFMDAITVSPGDDDDDDDEEKDGDEEKLPSCSDYVMHFITIFWKVLIALIPPTDYLDGWLCFMVSILAIGLLTAIIGDLASHFGCTVGLKDTVTAISFVALGTSIPDTFASKVAAINDKYADSSIGNVTGSNAVNVFLGLGIAWSLAAIYHAINNSVFEVDPGSLAYSVTIFCTMAFIAIMILLLRRSKKVGGELGGPIKYKVPTVLIFIFFWLLYIVLSSLEVYGIIPGF